MRLTQVIQVVLVVLGGISFAFNLWQVYELSGPYAGARRAARRRATGADGSGAAGRGRARRGGLDPGVLAALAPIDATRRRVARVSSARRRDLKLFQYLGLAVQSLLDDAALTATAGGARGKFLDPTDLLRAQWVVHGESSTTPGEIADVDVLWGMWVTNAEFFDARLHDGVLVNSLLGLEHDALGTPATFASAHRRCVLAHGYRRCDHASPSLFIHAHTDPSRFESVFGEDTLADLATWRDLARNDVRAIWVAKPASYARSQVHRAAELFGATQLLASNDKLPTGIWALSPYVTSPLMWKAFRFVARAWVAVTSVVPLRVYVLQDAWAHLAAEPYKEEQLSTNYKTRCMHFHSPDNCRYFVDKPTLRANTQEFQGDLSVRRGDLHPYSFWAESVWPSIESAATRTVLMAWPQLAAYELILRREGFNYKRVALLDVLLLVDEKATATVHDVDVAGGAADESLECSLTYELDALMLTGVNGFPSRPYYRDELARQLSGFCASRAAGGVGGGAAGGAGGAGGGGSGGCTQEEAAPLVALYDELQHAGNFKLTFPVVEHSQPAAAAGADAGSAAEGAAGESEGAAAEGAAGEEGPAEGGGARPRPLSAKAGCAPYCHFFRGGPTLASAESSRPAEGSEAAETAAADAMLARRANELTWAYLRAFPPRPHRGPQFSRDGSCKSTTSEDASFLRDTEAARARGGEADAGPQAEAAGADLVAQARAQNRTASTYAGQRFTIDRPVEPEHVHAGGL